MTTTRKTEEEIQALKRNWEGDPCWDLEGTEGFEAHREELQAHRLKMEKHWAEDREAKIMQIAETWGLPGNREFGLRIEALLNRVSALEEKANDH